MHALDTLASGIRGAENGTVKIYQRATTNYATIYPDFEGSSSSVPVAALSLDANGARVAFVNELVDVLVYNSAGTLLKQFGAGSSAPDIEVRSASFLGTAYTGGGAAAGLPTTLQAVLDKALASFGSTDWNVDWGLGAVPIYFALSAIGGMFVNVKNITYGAVGDGVVDDHASIQAAINAAASGGIVFFPPGTYRTTQSFTVGAKVSLMGCGPAASVIKIDDATANLMEYSNASGTDWQFASGLKFSAAQSNSGKHVNISALVRLAINDCVIGDANTTGTAINGAAGGDGSIVKMNGGTIQLAGPGGFGLAATHFVPVCFGVRFVPPATFNGTMASCALGGTFVACSFELGTISSGTCTILELNQTAPSRGAHVLGCHFPAVTGGTCTVFKSASSDCFQEAGNTVDPNLLFNFPAGGGGTTNTRGSFMGSREKRREYHADDTTPVTIKAKSFATAVVSRTTNANQTLTIDAPLSNGDTWTLAYVNNNAGAIVTVTLSGSTPKGLASFGVNATAVSYYFFRAVDSGSNVYWALVGSDVNQVI